MEMKGIKGIGVKLVVSALVLSMLFGTFMVPAFASPAPVVSVSPASQTVNPGATFSINITVDPDGKGVSSGELHFAFNASVMQVNSVTAGDLLGASPLVIGLFINNIAGTVVYALARQGTTTPPTPAGTFATITITVNGAAPSGTYGLNITSMGLTDESFQLITGIVINDGVVTVGPTLGITAEVDIKPENLNLASQRVFTAFIQLPEGYDLANINVSTIVCEGAPAVKGMVAGNRKYIAKFDREDLVGVEPGPKVKLTVTGKLYDGTPFEGSDTIRVINKGKSK